MNNSSRRVILVCEECGERTVLGGLLSVWYSTSTSFGCGRELTLADRLDQLRVGRARDVMSAEGPVSLRYR
jgi:hypothetical protein